MRLPTLEKGLNMVVEIGKEDVDLPLYMGPYAYFLAVIRVSHFVFFYVLKKHAIT